MEGGNFEVKFLTASLNEKVPDDLVTFYNDREDESDILIAEGVEAGDAGEELVSKGTKRDNSGVRPAGFFGRTLGYELDLKYTYRVGGEVAMGIAAAAAVPGTAWKNLYRFRAKKQFSCCKHL